METFGLVNAHMFGAATEPGEHVNWSEPDYFQESMFWDLGYDSIEQYAQDMPHMIVFTTEEPTMYGISLNFTHLDPIAVVTECYVSEVMSDELLRLNDGNVLCTHCQDGGYIRAAKYSVVASYRDWDNQIHHYNNRVCDQHMIAEAENFRDLEK